MSFWDVCVCVWSRTIIHGSTARQPEVPVGEIRVFGKQALKYSVITV